MLFWYTGAIVWASLALITAMALRASRLFPAGTDEHALARALGQALRCST